MSDTRDGRPAGRTSRATPRAGADAGLLAINAAVEAARAGERGLAFTVIADEIGRLAASTQSETDGVVRTILSLRALRTTIPRGAREVSRGASAPVHVGGTRIATVVLMERTAG